MLKTGTVPVSDQVHRLPSVATGEGKSCFNHFTTQPLLTSSIVKGKTPVHAQEEDDEEEELRRLQAEMAM